MPTILTHAAVAIGLARVPPGRHAPSQSAIVAGAMLAVLPDADVIAFVFGIPYASPFGHRGCTHSLAFALAVALVATLALRVPAPRRPAVFLYLALAATSHPLLDALTDGGLGVALWWPVDDARFFFPWQPIAVSPIGRGFFGRQGLEVLLSELRWVWLPLAAVVLAARSWRRRA